MATHGSDWLTAPAYKAALADWTQAFGAENVLTDTAARDLAQRSTFSSQFTIPAILRPADRAGVQEALRIANRHCVPVYPISAGRNWGYGSRLPSADGCVLLDLAGINRVVDYSEELAYITVEPGVTQRQAMDYLRERRSKLWLDATGASPDSSLIGNTVERGFGHTPYGDHFAHCCGLEVVLPSGEVMETGFARFAGSRAGALHRWGVGPYVDGLFTQSNFGVVTRMSIWLMPAPEYFQAYFFRCDRDAGLAPLIDAVRRLRLSGTIRSTVHIVNGYKVLSGLRQYPWEELKGRTPLLPEDLPPFAKQLQFGAWNASGGLYGTRTQVKEARRLMGDALKGHVDKLQFVDRGKLNLAARFSGVYRMVTGWDITRALELVKPVFGLLEGIPTDQPLASTYWRKRAAPPRDMDPDRDGCGLLWCSPVAPAEGRAARELVDLASRTLLEFRFEPAISLTFVNERSIACVVSLTYDREVAGEDERALACYDALTARLAAAGFYSYRLTSRSAAQMAASPGYDSAMRAVKQTLDPNGILAPRRYVA